jgi:hypothetical protein
MNFVDGNNNKILSRVWRLYETGFGLSTGFNGSQYSTLNYSVNTLQLTRNWVSIDSLGLITDNSSLTHNSWHHLPSLTLQPSSATLLPLCPRYISWRQTVEKTLPWHCWLSSRYQVTSTPQAYGVHVTLFLYTIWRWSRTFLLFLHFTPRSQVGCPIQILQTKIYCEFHRCHMRVTCSGIPFSLIWSSNYYIRSTTYEVPHYVILKLYNHVYRSIYKKRSTNSEPSTTG